MRRPQCAALAPTNEASAEAMKREYFKWKPSEAGSI